MENKFLIKDGASRFENLISQPLKEHKVFNNHKILTCGWYPVCSSNKLKKKSAFSFKILDHRIVLYRSQKGHVYALDAFCPHLGADLGNGIVKGENLQCYFHRWEFNHQGELENIPCLENKTLPKDIKNNHYPVQELYGHIWVYAGKSAKHTVLKPSGLEDEDVKAVYLKEVSLYAHHHIMMANGVDLQHFKSVHNLAIDFDFKVSENNDGTFVWKLKGDIPKDNIKTKLTSFMLGNHFEYHIKFGGGSMIVISYGVNAKLLGIKVPSLNVLWGCVPQKNGISKVKLFLVTKKRTGLLGPIKSFFCYLFSALLLMVLKDEDIKAFPHMRFNTNTLICADASLSRFINLIDKCEISSWSELD